MTGRADTDLTARLADALLAYDVGWSAALRLAAALLPVVREYGDQRAAEERGKLAEERGKLAEEIATLIAGRLALLDVARDPSLLNELAIRGEAARRAIQWESEAAALRGENRDGEG